MIDINLLRELKNNIVVIGNHPKIIQSILDFDYLIGKKSPSIKVIISSGRNYQRFFFGEREILVPVFNDVNKIPYKSREEYTLFLNLNSSRRIKSSTFEVFEKLPNIIGGVIFAENTPEKHSIEINKEAVKRNKFVVGPSSVGILIPGFIKLGPIGGIETKQFLNEAFLESNNGIAVFSSSGGMTNEILSIVKNFNKTVSFSLSFGGDRFPILSPVDAFLAAENDPKTLSIAYFGELGGVDEYKIAEVIKSGKVKKRVVCYIAGRVANEFENPPQFGHAKAFAGIKSETADSKIEALRKSGVEVADNFAEFTKLLEQLPSESFQESENYSKIQNIMTDRKHALIASSISKDEDGEVKILGEDLISLSKNYSLSYIVASLFLGKKIKSKELEDFVDYILKLLVDHGPQVSGALNVIVTSRAGKDLASSLSSGLLTIGPRFGGAINEAAKNYLTAIENNKSASDFTEDFASKKIYISGIGHKRYSLGNPDPRVNAIFEYSSNLNEKKYTKFAQEVEKITTAKKGNLILNVDGAIACTLLDILSEKEKLSEKELDELVSREFFNAIFILSRSIGFLAHALDQKKLDEGLLRLDDDQVAEAKV